MVHVILLTCRLSTISIWHTVEGEYYKTTPPYPHITLYWRMWSYYTHIHINTNYSALGTFNQMINTIAFTLMSSN